MRSLKRIFVTRATLTNVRRFGGHGHRHVDVVSGGRYRLVNNALGNAVAMRQGSWALGVDP